jgi:glutamine amidotransferase-like uncharacterized protein
MKKRIAVFIDQPRCSIQSGNGIIHALESDYNFKVFTPRSLESDFFDDVDCVAVPGGLGDASTFERVFRHNGKRVREFVEQGGHYLGICMGAYWADPNYLGILKGVQAEQYIRRPGTDTRRPHAKALQVNWQGQTERMFFYDGCSLIHDKKSDVQVWATYANGDTMALMQGRAGVIGCHPESEPHWYTQYSYMKPHWHQTRHHQLLKDFVDQLLKR